MKKFWRMVFAFGLGLALVSCSDGEVSESSEKEPVVSSVSGSKEEELSASDNLVGEDKKKEPV